MRGILYQLRLRRALNAMSTGEHAVARKIWKKLSKGNPNAHGMRHNIALTYIGEERYAEAEPLLFGEIEDFGEYYPRLRALADMYYSWGKRSAAHEWYKKIDQRDDCPDSERKLIQKRVELSFEDSLYSDVLESLEHVREGNALLEKEQWQEARESFRKASELDPTNIQAMNNIGTIELNNNDDPKAARDWFKKALEWSDVPWLRKNLSLAEKAIEL